MNKIQTTQNLLQSDNFKNQLKLALPKHLDANRMLRICLTEMRKTPKLASCDPTSFLGAVIQCSQLGLEPGSGLGQAYLIPYGKEVTMQIGYQGLIDLAMRSGKVDSIIADCVYTEDEFDFFTDGKGQHIYHKPNWESERADKDIKIVYAMAQIKGGGCVMAWMTRAEMDAHRKKFSKGGNIWNNHFAEMAKKTVIRRLYKFLPKSIEMRDTLENEASNDLGVKPEPANQIDLPQIEETQPVGSSVEDIKKLNAELDAIGKAADKIV